MGLLVKDSHCEGTSCGGIYLVNIDPHQLMFSPGQADSEWGAGVGKHCVHSLLAGSQGRGKKTQAKVCVKWESESQRERKKIACVILKALLLGQFLLAILAASPLESHRASLGPSCPATFADSKGSHLQANSFCPRKKIKRN